MENGKNTLQAWRAKEAAQLDTWKKGKQSTWNITINEVEVKHQLLRKRRITEDKLKNEMTKRRKLQSEVDALKTRAQVKKQAKEIAGVKYGNPTTQRNPKKLWSESSRQLKHKRKKKLANELLHATSFCEDNGFKPCSVELENTETGIHETPLANLHHRSLKKRMTYTQLFTLKINTPSQIPAIMN